jgi:hypothetical protein
MLQRGSLLGNRRERDDVPNARVPICARDIVNFIALLRRR